MSEHLRKHRRCRLRVQSKKESERVPLRLPSVGVLGLGFYTQSGHAVSGADFGAGEKLFFRADLARLWLHIECRTLFCETTRL